MQITIIATVDAESVSGMKRSEQEVAEAIVERMDGDIKVAYSVYDVTMQGWRVEPLDAGDRHIVLMCGARDWTKRVPVRRELRRLIKMFGKDKLLIIEGGADGADTIANEEAHKLGVHVATIDAIWDVYHRAAGPHRNNWMLALRPEGVIAFHEQISKSKGTADMAKKAQAAGVPVKVVKK